MVIQAYKNISWMFLSYLYGNDISRYWVGKDTNWDTHQ